MILCDTNILIEFYKNNPEIINQLRLIGVDKLAISAITQAELYYGAINKVELNQIKKHLKLLLREPKTLTLTTEFIGTQQIAIV